MKEDGQGDCFVPRKDGKSLMIHHFLNEGTTSPWFLQKPDDIPFPEMKELKSIRHCEKTPEEKFFIFQNDQRGFRGNLLKLVPLNDERRCTRRLLRASQGRQKPDDTPFSE